MCAATIVTSVLAQLETLRYPGGFQACTYSAFALTALVDRDCGVVDHWGRGDTLRLTVGAFDVGTRAPLVCRYRPRPLDNMALCRGLRNCHLSSSGMNGGRR
jgi:hypothetical protein